VHAGAVVGECANSGQREICLHLRTPWGSAGVREMWRHRAQQRSTPVKREAVIAGLAAEGLALILGSAELRIQWSSASVRVERSKRAHQ